jgi:hypothetical protein
MASDLRSEIRTLILSVVEPLVRWTRIYPATVVSQSGSTLDVRIEVGTQITRSKALGLTQVPLRGIPGVECKVKPGTVVLVGFEDADQGRPIASLTSPEGLMEIKITASARVEIDAPTITMGGAPVLRVGDTVAIPGPSGGAAGMVSITTPAGGVPTKLSA